MRRMILAVTLLVVARPATAETLDSPDIPPNLTLDEAVRILRTRSLDLFLAEASVSAAEGAVRVAHQVYNPNLSIGYAHIFNYDPSVVCPPDATGARPGYCTPEMITLALGDNAAIEDALSRKRGLRISVANAALKAARMSRADAERNLVFQVKQQYMQALLARDQLDLATESLKGWQASLELTTIRYKAGSITERDEAQIETAKLEAEQAISQSRQALRVAKLGLAFLLGVRDKIADFTVAADLPKYAVPPRLASATPESLVELAWSTRPDLRALQAQQERATASIRQARRSRFPDIALSVNFTMSGVGGGSASANTTPPTLGIGLAGNLPVFYQQQGEITQAEADLRTQTVAYAKARAQVLADVATAFANFATTRELVERMEGRLLDRARTQRDLTKIQFDKGATSLLEYLEAQRTFIATNVEYLTDLANYWTAVFQLEAAVGADLR